MLFVVCDQFGIKLFYYVISGDDFYYVFESKVIYKILKDKIFDKNVL